MPRRTLRDDGNDRRPLRLLLSPAMLVLQRWRRRAAYLSFGTYVTVFTACASWPRGSQLSPAASGLVGEWAASGRPRVLGLAARRGGTAGAGAAACRVDARARAGGRAPPERGHPDRALARGQRARRAADRPRDPQPGPEFRPEPAVAVHRDAAAGRDAAALSAHPRGGPRRGRRALRRRRRRAPGVLRGASSVLR